MTDIEDFVKSCVTIDYKKEHGQFAYFPFNMFVEKKDGSVDLIVIASREGGVLNIYKIMFKYINSGIKRLYVAIDFPAGMDIKNDFVGVISYELSKEKGKQLDIFAIPYNEKTGEIYKRINRSPHLNMIILNIALFAKKYM
jgi:hypothetical protein